MARHAPDSHARPAPADPPDPPDPRDPPDPPDPATSKRDVSAPDGTNQGSEAGSHGTGWEPPPGPVLFLAEAVTLAHVARPSVLARGLRQRWGPGASVQMACDSRYRTLFDEEPPWLPLDSIPSSQFLQALSRGKPVYDASTLGKYVQADLAMIDRLKPAVVISDFRLSAPVACELRNVPCITLSNAYWSPHAMVPMTVPELSVVKVLERGGAMGLFIAQQMFNRVIGRAMTKHLGPMNQVRVAHGLAPLSGDVRQAYTQGTLTAYADVPPLVKLRPGHATTERFLGPVPWSPRTALPRWWDVLPTGQQMIYLSMGSSGQAALLPSLAAAAASLDAVVLVATAGRASVPEAGNVFVADYLPGDLAAQRADLVICNGGSPATGQALAAGKPVLGVPSNLDQFLNMRCVTDAGAGCILRPGQCHARRLRPLVAQMLADTSLRESARRLARVMETYDPVERLAEMVAEVAPSDAHADKKRPDERVADGLFD